MLNKLMATLREYRMVEPGERVICALSGGADSVAMTFGLYLLRDKLGITLEAAHFNHHLRGAESQRDERFVTRLCSRLEIPLHLAGGEVRPGEKGLEAAAREARYGFFETLPGKVATAHTADDNGETVVMHLIRGTGLKGLGGIAPVRERYIRPMLNVTREEVLAFLREYRLDYVEDSSNTGDDFLRNRIRHHVMPLLAGENPRLAENLSTMAQSLREDEEVLESLAGVPEPDVATLREMPRGLRRRALRQYLIKWGVREPENAHVAQLEALVMSEKASARGNFPGGVSVGREYGRLICIREEAPPEPRTLTCPGTVVFGNYRISATFSEETLSRPDCFTVTTRGRIRVRSRQVGDSLRRSGGRKTLKKLFIDAKIPAGRRMAVPVIADEDGILGVATLGPDRDRLGPGVCIRVEPMEVQPWAETKI